MAFDAAERSERFGRSQCQRSREQQQQRKVEETIIPLQKGSKSQTKKQSYPSKLSEN